MERESPTRPDTRPPIHPDELDALRIHNISRARRAALRFRSYCLITAAACGIEIIDLLWRALRRFLLARSPTRPAIYVLAAAILAYLALRLMAQAARLGAEARHHGLPEPSTPPDFTNLSDGSQIVRNLHDIQDD